MARLDYHSPMPERRRVYLARQGTPTWEDWWVERKGHSRSQTPDENQLIGFANYDLRDHRLPELKRDPQGQIWVEVDREQAPDVLDVMRRHGFEYARD
jgi:hypothetical protein